jgi:hypothetical protein
MKKLALITVGVVAITAMSSCEKKYTCTCVYPNAQAGTTKTDIKAYRRSDAQATCSNMNTGARLSGGACAL